MISITERPINVDDVINAVANKGAGAINVFVGTVRDNTRGNNVVLLEYEAYESMAISEMRRIKEEAEKRWHLLGCAIFHRTGALQPGETAVVIAVSTPHRKDSFDACEYIIEKLKETVPIWKKEIFENGEQWVSAHP